MTQETIFLTKVREKYGDIERITRTECSKIYEENRDIIHWPAWLVNNPIHKVGKELYQVPWKLLKEQEPVMTTENKQPKKATIIEDDGIVRIPSGIPYYTPFGFHNDLKNIVRSGLWCPVFITGLSGCGKTTIVEQVCAEEKRELYRINITTETDEDDLLGGMRLVNGETVFRYGPVVEALKRGALLLLDEIDYGSNKLACLQPVLEGKGVFIKKLGLWVPANGGFNVFATANTKGKGDDDGKFIGTNVMNEAFLDRFDFTIEHNYPPKSTEIQILNEFWVKFLGRSTSADSENFIDVLVNWADQIRTSYKNGSADDVISTRRLTQAIKAYAIFGDRKKAVELCLSRFSDHTKANFMGAYSALDVSSLSKEKQEAYKRAAEEEAAKKAANAPPFGQKMKF